MKLLIGLMVIMGIAGPIGAMAPGPVNPGQKLAAVQLLFKTEGPCLYEWVDSSTLFICDCGDAPRNPALFHLDTGKRSLLNKLQAMTAKVETADKFEFTEAYELSPDGKYMLWNRSDGTVHVSLLNGTKHHVWSQPDNGDLEFSPIARWLSDGHSWVEDDVATISRRHPENQRGAYVGDMLAPTRHARKYSPDRSKYLIYAKAVLSTGHSYNGTVLVPRQVNGRTVQKMTYPTAPLPVSTSEVSGSPNREWLAWALVHRTYSQAGKQQLEDITGEIWITSLTGKKQKKVLALPLSRAEDGNDAPYLLRWTPDGKAISYIWKGVLYRTPLNLHAAGLL